MKLKNLFILLGIILVSTGLTMGSFAIFNPIKEARIKEETLKKVTIHFTEATDFDSNPVETVDGVEILLSLKVYKEDEALGYLYEGHAENSFGHIRIQVSVGLDERIIEVKIVELNQTMYQTETMNLVSSYEFVKLSSNVPDADAGATSISIQTLMHMIQAIGKHHDTIEKFDIQLPYEDIFGEYQVINTENKNVSGAQVIIETISDDKGVVYTITKSGIYMTGSPQEKELTVVVITNSEGEILSVLLPLDLYGHTKSYRPKALIYAESFIGEKLGFIADAYTGSSDPNDGEPNNTKLLIHDMLKIAKEVYVS